MGKSHLRMEREVALTNNAALARGVIYVHSAPRALCPHVEWAAGRALGRAVNFDWREQPVLKGASRTEFFWEGERGTGAALASAQLGAARLRGVHDGRRDRVRPRRGVTLHERLTEVLA